MASWVRSSVAACCSLLSTLLVLAPAVAQIKVIPVPYRPHDLTIPQMAYPEHPTRFKAIARNIPVACGTTPYFRWDIDGDGEYTAADQCLDRTRLANVGDGTWYQDDRYQLDCLQYLPTVPVEIKRKLFMATIEVACAFDVDKKPTDSRVGTYRVMLFNDVPRGRRYSTWYNSSRYGYTARPEEDQNGNAIPAICNGEEDDGRGNCQVTNFPCATDADCVGDSDFSLKVKREVALGDGLWYLHKSYAEKNGHDTASIDGRLVCDSTNSCGTQQYSAAAAAFLWALTMNGHYPAYPSKSSTEAYYTHGTKADAKAKVRVTGAL